MALDVTQGRTARRVSTKRWTDNLIEFDFVGTFTPAPQAPAKNTASPPNLMLRGRAFAPRPAPFLPLAHLVRRRIAETMSLLAPPRGHTSGAVDERARPPITPLKCRDNRPPRVPPLRPPSVGPRAVMVPCPCKSPGGVAPSRATLAPIKPTR